MTEYRAAFLCKAGHIVTAGAQTNKVGRHGEYAAYGDNAGSSNAGDQHID